MKALVINEYGSPDNLCLQEIELPELRPYEVRIKIHATGVNFVDTLLMAGTYQLSLDLPFIPGSEIAGEILKVGDEVTDLRVGDRVVALRPNGGLAEQINISSRSLKVIPDNMDYVTAASFFHAYSSVWFALVMRGKIEAGDTILVLGASGGAGLAAIDISKALGCKVIAAASSDEKLQLCLKAGADETINYSEQNLKEEAKCLGGGGVSMVFDPVGGELSEQALRACLPEGRFVVFGFASGIIPKIPLNLPLLKNCQIIGADAKRGEMGDSRQPVLDLFSEGKLHPLAPSNLCSLAEAPEAYNDLIQRKSIGKSVVKIN